MKNSMFIFAAALFLMTSCTLSQDEIPQPFNDFSEYAIDSKDPLILNDSPQLSGTMDFAERAEKQSSEEVSSQRKQESNDAKNYRLQSSEIPKGRVEIQISTDDRPELYNGAVDKSKGLKATDASTKHKTD